MLLLDRPATTDLPYHPSDFCPGYDVQEHTTFASFVRDSGLDLEARRALAERIVLAGEVC